MSHTAWPNLLQRLIRIAEILLSLPARPQRRCALQDDGAKSSPRLVPDRELREDAHTSFYSALFWTNGVGSCKEAGLPCSA
jgi:hypothetical protein